MAKPLVVTGDDFSVSVQLKKGVGSATPEPFSISGSGVVKARLVSIDYASTYSAEVSQSSAAAGADYSTSLVVVNFGSADTSGITFQGDAWIEIQVADTTKTTWWVACQIRRGNIA